jgi:predicted Fe-S protein YdhL (DUF1289 family)
MTRARYVESPCTGVCTLDLASDICFGCGRTLNEIERWVLFTGEERVKILAELPARLATLHPPKD